MLNFLNWLVKSQKYYFLQSIVKLSVSYQGDEHIPGNKNMYAELSSRLQLK